jgi:hypothetical protein
MSEKKKRSYRVYEELGDAEKVVGKIVVYNKSDPHSKSDFDLNVGQAGLYTERTSIRRIK